MTQPLIIAHRGSHRTVPENTMAAFEAAIACRADMIELDIRRSQDGSLIVFHDASIQNRLIRDLPCKSIRDLGLKQGIDIPLFEDVLKLTRNRIKLDIEIKETGSEHEIVTLVLKYFRRNDFAFTSFLETSLQRIKEMDPGIRVGLIVGEEGFRLPLKTRIYDRFPFKRCLRSGIDIIVPHWKILGFGFIRRARQYRLPVWTWTVNSVPKMRKYLCGRRVNGIITDKPELAVRISGGSG